MAYILLALGIVMSITGLAAMAIGYPIIEVERGWATLITGAVLLSGGFVVVGLGFVVRHLIGLRGALATVGSLPPVAEAPVPQPMVVPTPLMPAMPAAPSLHERPPPAGAATFAPGAPPALAAAVPVAAAALAAGAMHGHDAHEAELEADLHEFQAEDAHVDDAHAAADALEDHVPADHVLEEHPHEPTAPPALGLVHEPAESPPPAPEPPASAELARQMSTDQLLDQAFSAFDYEMSNGHPPTGEAAAPAHDTHHPESPAPEPDTAHEPPAHEQTANAPPMHELPVHETEAEVHVSEPSFDEPHEPAPHDAEPEAHEPLVAEAPATAPAEPAANLTVIGRYDSEGTSYVMYSDGSIEAQSEGGIYRFGSMAELKAFIEG